MKHTAFLFAGTLFFCFPFSVNAENRMPEMKLETSAHETMEATLRQSMEGRKEEKAKSYLTKHAVTEEKEPSDFSLHVKNAPIQEVLRSLAELTGKNIVFGGTVTGSVTADLDHVTPKEALHAMLVSQGLIAREEGSTLIVVGESAMKMGEEQRNPINCLMRKRKKWRKGFASFPTAFM